MTTDRLKLAIYYKDIYTLDRAVPLESKTVAKSLSTGAEIKVLGEAKAKNLTPEGIESINYNGWLDLWIKIRQLKDSGIDAIIIQAPFIFSSIVSLLFCAIAGLPVIIQDFGQISQAALQKKLFKADPDVRTLETAQYGGSPQNGWKNRVKDGVSRASKRTALLLMRLLNGRVIKGWLAFSSFSREQLALYIGVDATRTIIFPWPALPCPFTRNNANNWYESTGKESGMFRFVVWSRLDYWMKGIDRLLDGTAKMFQQRPDLKDRIRVYIIGPDYENGGSTTQKHIERLGLGGTVFWLAPGEYPAGSLQPLADANASVLFSRWDGFPRALRESLALGVPIVVSRETHFEDIVQQFHCGSVAKNADDPSSVADALIATYENSRQQNFAEAAIKAHGSLSMEALSHKVLPSLAALFK